jgi:hypothetical protein
MHQRIEPHKTKLHPLPAMDINESSTTGNADVISTILKGLNLLMSKNKLIETMKLVSGDQLSIA